MYLPWAVDNNLVQQDRDFEMSENLMWRSVQSIYIPLLLSVSGGLKNSEGYPVYQVLKGVS